MAPSNSSGKYLFLQAYVPQCSPASKVVCMCRPFLGCFTTAVFYGFPQVRLEGLMLYTHKADKRKPKPRTKRG